MRFELNEDQIVFFDALDAMVNTADAGFRAATGWERFDWADGLDSRIAANGYFDVGAEAEFGGHTAAELVFRLARLPVVVESAASAMLRPFLGADLPRPLAVTTTAGNEAIRFLPVARSLIRLERGGVSHAAVTSDKVAPLESLFAYPMGRLTGGADWKPLPCDPAQMMVLWQIATAAEIAGNLSGALASVLEHVRVRTQFGRPLGSFQGMQHRLAMASVKIEGAHLLTLKAAQSLAPVDAATALGNAQQISTAICYDLHQFMGAMGLTLEHPLHRWTYRARLLRVSLGGASRNLADGARQRWRAS
ncbi:MAG: hypothetical protein JJT95_05375 [Pararhodobacter sp.]|nr:hypothetical protein [Pararhodobacter sp.]